MAHRTGQLDTRIEIVTPENIAFQYRIAGPFRRLPAYLIDLAIRLVVGSIGFLGLVMIFGMASVGSLGIGLGLVLAFLLTWFYGGLFETLWNGQTPGKRIMGIRVLSTDGQPINALQAILRNVLRTVDAQPVIFYMLGLLAAIVNDRFQRLGDLACGTMVVVEEHRWLHGVTRIDEPEPIRLAGRIPPDFQPSRTLARALATYVGRRESFPLPRRMEIAQLLGLPLLEKLRLPPETNLDDLLCALYHRTFITDRDDRAEPPWGSPFALQQTESK